MKVESITKVPTPFGVIITLVVDGVQCFDHLSPGISGVDEWDQRRCVRYAVQHMGRYQGLVKVPYHVLLKSGLRASANGRIFVRFDTLDDFMEKVTDAYLNGSCSAGSCDMVRRGLVKLKEIYDKGDIMSIGECVKNQLLGDENLIGTEKIRYSNGVIIEQDVYEAVTKIIVIGDLKFTHDPVAGRCQVSKITKGTRVSIFDCEELDLDVCKDFIENNLSVQMDIGLVR